MNLMDYHHHTNHSFDSTASMEDICEKAIEKNVREICFTEHYSLNPLAPTYGHMNFEKYIQDIAYCREKFNQQLVIKMGIEICEPHLLKDAYYEILNPLGLDFILGSVHNINNEKLRKYLENKDIHTAYNGYFEEIYQMVECADIDVIAHLDLLKRYSINSLGIYDFPQFKNIIEAILKKAIDRNIGIEINTSGLRGKLNETLPSIEIIQLYKDLGGEILTIGSDSHSADFVGSHLSEAISMAKECGFKSIYKFEKRNPIGAKI
ncbi:histidinol-phosphatase HisJ family protein [Heyndrickxia sp. NPDC080065]|uniref:histidinol-phosphatase HisJ family protein n=1 Tax=Heyndrickxia sp. NPDC080065 TaxID=3390568 RepID=UPI003CFF3328